MKHLQRIFAGVFLTALLFGGFFSSCQSPMSARQTRQTHLPRQVVSLPKTSVKAAVAQVIACLEAEGYQIEACSEELGFINASKKAAAFSDEEEIASSLLEVTVHVKALAEGGCTVKAHFVGKDFDASGIVTALRPVQESDLYEKFLGQIQQDMNSPQDISKPQS